MGEWVSSHLCRAVERVLRCGVRLLSFSFRARGYCTRSSPRPLRCRRRLAPSPKETRSCAPWSQTLSHVGWRKWIPARASPLRPLTFHYGRAPLVNSSDTPCPEAWCQTAPEQAASTGTAQRKSSSPCFKHFPARALHHQRDSAVCLDPSSGRILDPSPYKIKGPSAQRSTSEDVLCRAHEQCSQTRGEKLSTRFKTGPLGLRGLRHPSPLTVKTASRIHTCNRDP